MKRKVSNQNSEKKAELRKLVLAQLAKMRKKMKREHPGMLENVRKQVEENKAKPAKKKSTPPPIAPNEIAIDQGKNMETIQKMLDLKSDNSGFEKAVKAMVSKTKT